MPRAIDSTTALAASKIEILPVLFVHMDVVGDVLNAWSGPDDRSLSGYGDTLLNVDWLSTRNLVEVSDIIQDSSGAINEISFQLAAPSPDVAPWADFINRPADWSQRRCVVWVGFLTAGSYQLVGPPVRMLTGVIVGVGAVDGSDPRLTVTAASRAFVGQRANDWRLSDAHQQQFWPGDLALEYVITLNNVELRWGIASDKVSRGGGGGSPSSSGGSGRFANAS